MRVVWGATARRDRNAIFAYLAERNPLAAVRIDQRLFAAASSLDRAPERGRVGVVVGTRELVASFPYLLVYEVDHERQIVRILRVWHAAQARS